MNSQQQIIASLEDMKADAEDGRWQLLSADWDTVPPTE